MQIKCSISIRTWTAVLLHCTAGAPSPIPISRPRPIAHRPSITTHRPLFSFPYPTRPPCPGSTPVPDPGWSWRPLAYPGVSWWNPDRISVTRFLPWPSTGPPLVLHPVPCSLILFTLLAHLCLIRTSPGSRLASRLLWLASPNISQSNFLHPSKQ
jgi:hypothetical protein